MLMKRSYNMVAPSFQDSHLETKPRKKINKEQVINARSKGNTPFLLPVDWSSKPSQKGSESQEIGGYN